MKKIHRMFAIAAAAAMMMAPAVGSASALDSAGLRANAASVQTARLAKAPTVAQKRAAVKNGVKSRTVRAKKQNKPYLVTCSATLLFTSITPRANVTAKVLGTYNTKTKKYDYNMVIDRKSDLYNSYGYLIGSVQHWGRVDVDGKTLYPKEKGSGQKIAASFSLSHPVTTVSTAWNVYSSETVTPNQSYSYRSTVFAICQV